MLEIPTPAVTFNAYRLEREDKQLDLAFAAAPTPGEAIRTCRTDDEAPVEVVEVDGTEVLLIRPQVLPIGEKDAQS